MERSNSIQLSDEEREKLELAKAAWFGNSENVSSGKRIIVSPSG